MDRAREIGACDDCIQMGPRCEREGHPGCYRAIIEAFDERYGGVPNDRLRTVMAIDHANGVIGA